MEQSQNREDSFFLDAKAKSSVSLGAVPQAVELARSIGATVQTHFGVMLSLAEAQTEMLRRQAGGQRDALLEENNELILSLLGFTPMLEYEIRAGYTGILCAVLLQAAGQEPEAAALAKMAVKACGDFASEAGFLHPPNANKGREPARNHRRKTSETHEDGSKAASPPEAYPVEAPVETAFADLGPPPALQTRIEEFCSSLMTKRKKAAPTILKKRNPLRVGFLPENDCAPIIVAQELGLFDKHGLAVESAEPGQLETHSR